MSYSLTISASASVKTYEGTSTDEVETTIAEAIQGSSQSPLRHIGVNITADWLGQAHEDNQGLVDEWSVTIEGTCESDVSINEDSDDLPKGWKETLRIAQGDMENVISFYTGDASFGENNVR